MHARGGVKAREAATPSPLSVEGKGWMSGQEKCGNSHLGRIPRRTAEWLHGGTRPCADAPRIENFAPHCGGLPNPPISPLIIFPFIFFPSKVAVSRACQLKLGGSIEGGGCFPRF